MRPTAIRVPLESFRALLGAVLCVACGGPSERESSAAELERLRSLPYASFAETEAAEAGVVLHREDLVQPGYTLYTVQPLALAELIDESGRSLRTWSLRGSRRWERSELLPGGDLLVIGVDDCPRDAPIPPDKRYLARFDWEGDLLWKRRLPAHHDVEVTPRGDLLVLTLDRRRAEAFDRYTDLMDDSLTLLDGEGTVVDRLSLFDAFAARPDVDRVISSQVPTPLTKRVGRFFKYLGRPASSRPFVDALHTNSVEWMSRPHLESRHEIFGRDNVLISIRHQDTIAVVNWPRRELLWSWGRGELSGPHDARALDTGNLLVFDNGLARDWSRVVEVDPVSERIVWEYRADPQTDFYTASRGSSQRLANGNTLVSQSDEGIALEVTSEGTEVWRFVSPYTGPTGKRAGIVRAIRYPASFFGDRISTP